MPEPTRLFRLDDDTGGFGLNCDAGGLALAGVPLLYRTAAGFAPRPRDEIDLLLRHANQGREQPLDLPDTGLRAVAASLNRNDLAKAQLAAVFMRVPELDTDSAVRLILADDVLTKYSPDQPRDDHGRWSAGGGGGGGGGEASASTADDPSVDAVGDDADAPAGPLLHPAAWTPPASRSPYPLGPKPPAPKFNAPGPSIHEIISEGSPRDVFGMIEDWMSFLHDINNMTMYNAVAQHAKVAEREEKAGLKGHSIEQEMLVDASGGFYICRNSVRFSDGEIFLPIPTYPDGASIIAIQNRGGQEQWTDDYQNWHLMRTDPPLIRPSN
jgi:hypothetical protein